MSLISRDPAVLAGQAFGKQHQYPDGFALFLGTMFAPIQDRDTARARASPTRSATACGFRPPSWASSRTRSRPRPGSALDFGVGA
jgi:hypothetical protein